LGEGTNSALGATNKCQYWSLMPDNEMACTKCLHQNSGIVKNYKVEHCYLYDEENRNCLQCKPGYKFDDSVVDNHKFKCVVGIVTNCGDSTILTLDYHHAIEDTCYNCADTHLLQDDGTCGTARTADSNCEILALIQIHVKNVQLLLF